MHPQIVAATVATLLTIAAATNVNQCTGLSIPNLRENVQLSPCTKPPCLLKKGTNQMITINFTPDEDVTDLKNSVAADVFGLRLPFIGVDGNSVCDKLYNEAGEKTPCPLKSGQKYTYKDSFAILGIYPTTKVKVYWSLVTAGNKKIICFEVPARIA